MPEGKTDGSCCSSPLGLRPTVFQPSSAKEDKVLHTSSLASFDRKKWVLLLAIAGGNEALLRRVTLV